MVAEPITPDLLRVIDNVASFTYRYRDDRGRMQSEKQALYRICNDGSLELMAGLRKRVEDVLKSVQCKVEVKYIDPKIFSDQAAMHLLSQQDIDDLNTRPDQIDVIGLVVDSPEGFIVEAPTGWGKSFVVSKICRILPKINIAVLAPGVDIVKTLYKRIRNVIPDVGIIGGGNRLLKRVTVCTMQSVDLLAKHHWDLLLFDEAHRAGGAAISESLADVFTEAKCVGFTASPHGRTDGADKVVEALFGPIAYKVSYAQGVERGSVVPIQVHMYSVERGPQLTSTSSYRANLYGIWNNLLRNKLIAKKAMEALASSDDAQVLIMVETAEHAIVLKELLPDFEVVFATASKKKTVQRAWELGVKLKKGAMSSEYRDYLRRQFEKREIRAAIATGVWNTGVDFCQLTHLIRAEGLASKIRSIQTPGRLSRLADGKEMGILIDFDDKFNPTLKRRADERRREYCRLGWEIIDKSDASVASKYAWDHR